jgi:TonB family protein
MRTTARNWLLCPLIMATFGAPLAAAEPPAPPPVPAPADTPAPAPQPTRAEVLQSANKMLVEGKYAEAEAEFRRAEPLGAGLCGECALGVAMVRASEGKWAETADMIQRSLPLLTTPASLAQAYNQLGMAYAKGAGGEDRLTKAEEAMRDAVDYGGPWGEIARRNLAQILFLKESWAESAQVAREALANAGTDAEATQAARVILCQARSHLPEELPEEPAPEGAGKASRPVRISGPNPEYTQEARDAKVAGTVIVKGTVDREGCLRNPVVVQGMDHGMSEAVLSAFRLWVFSPAVAGGKPVTAEYSVSVKFEPSAPPA